MNIREKVLWPGRGRVSSDAFISWESLTMRSHRARVAMLVAIMSSVTLPFAHGQEALDRSFFRAFRLTFWVSDVRRSVEFYKTTLGFQLDYCVVGEGKTVSSLTASDPEPYGARVVLGDQRLSLQKGEVGRPGGTRFIIEVADPTSYAARLSKLGVELNVIATQEGQPYWFVVFDPDGHRLEFTGPIRN